MVEFILFTLIVLSLLVIGLWKKPRIAQPIASSHQQAVEETNSAPATKVILSPYDYEPLYPLCELRGADGRVHAYVSMRHRPTTLARRDGTYRVSPDDDLVYIEVE